MPAKSPYLCKVAGVRSLRKQYLRTIRALTDGEQLLHATDNRGRAGLEGVLRERGIRGSVKLPPPAPDVNAAHGNGVYWLRGQPDGTYFKNPSSEGIITPKKGVYLRDNENALNIAGHPLAEHHALSSAYSLRGKDTAVVDTSGRQRDALIRLATGANPASEHASLADFGRKFLPTKNPRGLTETQWLDKKKALHLSDPELRTIKTDTRYDNPTDRDADIAEYIEDVLGKQPSGGIRRVDSQLLQLAVASSHKQPGALKPLPYEDKKIRELYLQQLKQRRQLRVAGVLPPLKSTQPK
jgi:hypothetical protein